MSALSRIVAAWLFSCLLSSLPCLSHSNAVPWGAMARQWGRLSDLHDVTVEEGQSLHEIVVTDGTNTRWTRRSSTFPQAVLGEESAADMSYGDCNLDDVRLVNRVNMWPPWPLSLLNRRKDASTNQTLTSASSPSSTSNQYPSAAILFLTYLKQRSRIGLRQLQEVGSSLWFHLPPAVPPILLLSSVPRKITVETITEVGPEMVTKRVIPLFSNTFARGMVLSGCGVAVVSWAHQEVNRKRSLTPLPLALPYQQSVSRVFLPPFLPEIVTETSTEASAPMDTTDDEDIATGAAPQFSSLSSPKLRKHLTFLYENTSLIGKTAADSILRPSNIFKEWRRARRTRQYEAAKVRRLAVFDELRALQSLKRKSAKKIKSKTKGSKSSSSGAGSSGVDGGDNPADKLGYALVTGASQGIGRALAVELARWEIPLVLVARDLDRLTALAYDLEACYGVPCCVLQADLSKVDAAERIYESTQKAGIEVDILVNNAGIGYEGLATKIETGLLEKMIMVNTMSYAKLSKLYGQDMIGRQRGRILMVSSMAGITTASPNMALYGATKAFERSLALSMAKELEPHGIGVTCLLPGPVTSTQFRTRSGTDQALCWYIPYYPRPAETVAHQGIMSLLDGDIQNVPGWQNRIFVQMLRPILPQRIETMCVHAAWSPVRLPWIKSSWRSKDQQQPVDEAERDSTTIESATLPPSPISTDSTNLKPRNNYQRPPKMLLLPAPPVPESVPEPSTSETQGDDELSTPSDDTDKQEVEILNPELAQPSVEEETKKVANSDESTVSLSKPDTTEATPMKEEAAKPPTSQSVRASKKSSLPSSSSTHTEAWGSLSPQLGPINLLEHKMHFPQSRKRQSEGASSVFFEV